MLMCIDHMGPCWPYGPSNGSLDDKAYSQLFYVLHFQFGEAFPTSASTKSKSAHLYMLHAGNFKGACVDQAKNTPAAGS